MRKIRENLFFYIEKCFLFFFFLLISLAIAHNKIVLMITISDVHPNYKKLSMSSLPNLVSTDLMPFF